MTGRNAVASRGMTALSARAGSAPVTNASTTASRRLDGRGARLGPLEEARSGRSPSAAVLREAGAGRRGRSW